MSPHVIGIIGESLNFIGAVLLACDILLRPSERLRSKQLEGLRRIAVDFGLHATYYKGVRVTKDEFVEDVLDRRATMFGLVGVSCLAIGFLFLLGYHIAEL